MVIQAENLTKRYGPTLAVDRVSFSVEQGEVVGFLGPNGAGKSTTMRMLTCFIPPTSGTARIMGLDVFSDSIEARRRIGYMPEAAPLYPDMRVIEYLRFRAAIKGVPPRDRRGRVAEVMDQCGVAGVQRKLIGALSKGYRQRVGLADALVADPPLLILDEPTIGLDPNQIRLVRQMIRGLAPKRTVLISTHILPEVEAVCSRVLIINRGRIACSQSVDELTRPAQERMTLRLEVRGPADAVAAALASAPGVAEALLESFAGGVAAFTIKAQPGQDPREEISRRMLSRTWPVRELRACRLSLEDIFARITAAEVGEEPQP
ncbi:MAG TPA: ATP-binding cassette domain-containing protein [Candidatus Brocadiia bacterium]|nr:ATP-binding cassette domain-containing protein [Candidatus Brocadiia bacterium]